MTARREISARRRRSLYYLDQGSSSETTPEDIASLVGYWPTYAANLTVDETPDPDVVTQIDDQSTNSNHMTSGLLSESPWIASNNLLEVDNSRWARVDAVIAAHAPASGDFTAIVAGSSSQTGDRALASNRGNGGIGLDEGWTIGFKSGEFWAVLDSGDGFTIGKDYRSTTGPYNDGTTRVYTFRWTRSSDLLELFVNNDELGSLTKSRDADMSARTVDASKKLLIGQGPGGVYQWTGDMGYLQLYNTALDDTTLDGLITWTRGQVGA